MTDDTLNLSSCPFCGGGETWIDGTKTRASLLEPDEVISVYVKHRCGGFERGAQSAFIQVRGRNRSDAIAAWNRRSVPFVPLAEVEKLTRERDEERAEVERLREALRDALDGLRYWVPQTSVGAVEKCRIVEKGIEALEAKP